MKKIILLAGFAVLLAACAEKPGYRISGTVSNTDLNGQYVYLYPYGEKEVAPLDSALVDNGTFTFNGVQEKPALRLLRFNSEVVKPTRVAPGLDGPFSVTFALENVALQVVLDSVSTVSGSPENDLYAAFRKEYQAVNDEMTQIYADARSEDKAVAEAAKAKYEALIDKFTKTLKDYVSSNPKSLLAGKTLADFRYNLSEEDQTEILAKADSVFKSAPGVDKLIAHLEVLKKVSVGKTFTDFEAADVKGEVKKLSDYVGNGKYVLVDFWASWCGPCRQEMPNLVSLYKKYKSKGFEIVGVSLDNDKAAWEKGIKDLNITWPQLSDLKGWQSESAALYGVNSIPHVLLIDKEGTIIAKQLRGEELEKKLEELLK